MKLENLLKGIRVLETNADMQLEVDHVAYDSRKVQSGGLFVARVPSKLCLRGGPEAVTAQP